MKLTDRTEKTSGFTPDDLLHLVSAGESWKVKASVLAANFATLQGSYNNGPSITTTTALGSVIFRNGKANDTLAVQEWKNIAGTTTASINGDGLIYSSSAGVIVGATSMPTSSHIGYFTRNSPGGPVLVNVNNSGGPSAYYSVSNSSQNWVAGILNLPAETTYSIYDNTAAVNRLSITTAGIITANGLLRALGTNNIDVSSSGAVLSYTASAPRLTLLQMGGTSGSRVVDFVLNSGAMAFRFRDDTAMLSTVAYQVSGAYNNIGTHTWNTGSGVSAMTLLGTTLTVNGDTRTTYTSGFGLYNGATMNGRFYHNGAGAIVLDRISPTSFLIQQATVNQFGIDSSGNATLYTGITTFATTVAAGGTYFTDSDSRVVIARTTALGTATNAHGFVDATIFQRTANGYANNAYTDNGKIIGAANYDHHAAFQSAFEFAGTGTVTSYYGFVDALTVGAGQTLTNRYGVSIFDPIGAGTIVNNYGVYVATQTKGTNKWGVFVNSDKSYFGGNVGMGVAPATDRRLHVRGSTSDATSFALYTEDVAGVAMFTLRNDKLAILRGDTILGGVATAASARVHIVGETADSTKLALVVQNSTSNTWLSIRNDGRMAYSGQALYLPSIPVGRTGVAVGEVFQDTAANILANSDLHLAIRTS